MTHARSSFGRRWFTRLLIASAVVVTLLIAGMLTFRTLAHRNVEAKLTAIRTAGQPVTPAELDAWYDRPAARPDPSPLYALALPDLAELDPRDYPHLPVLGDPEFPWTAEQEAAALAVTGNGNYFVSDSRYRADRGLPPDWREQVRALLDDHADALSTLREASTMGPARFAVDLRLGSEAPLAHLGHLRRAGQLLTLSAGLHYRAGETDAALDEIAVILGLARALDREPLLISTLVDISLRRLATMPLQHMIAAGRLTPDDLQRAIDMLQHELPDTTLQRALVGERALGNDWFLLSSPAAQQARPGLTPLRGLGVMHLDHLVYLERMQHAIDTAGRLHELDRQVIGQLDSEMHELPSYALVSGIVLPAISSSFDAALRHHAGHRLVRAAAMVQQHRQRTGEWPSVKTALADADWPTDPFNFQPLRYRIDDGGGVRLWSVGLDGQDNDGVAPRQPCRDEPGEDIVVTLPARGTLRDR